MKIATTTGEMYPYTNSSKLARIDAELKKDALFLLYKISKYILSAYDVYEK